MDKQLSPGDRRRHASGSPPRRVRGRAAPGCSRRPDLQHASGTTTDVGVDPNPARNARARLEYALRGLRNGAIDLRFGRPLSGGEVSRYRHLGSGNVVNSDYGALQQIFAGRVRPHDVLVDVGCGKGRVLNYWLRHFPTQRVIGLERDPDIGLATGRRLRRHLNCEVIVSDASVWLPDQGTLFFLYNPFNRDCTQGFLNRLNEFASDTTRVLYSNPRYCDVFVEDPAWSVEVVSLESRGVTPYDELAVITRVATDKRELCSSLLDRTVAGGEAHTLSHQDQQ